MRKKEREGEREIEREKERERERERGSRLFTPSFVIAASGLAHTINHDS
jgi:hypothetical protein